MFKTYLFVIQVLQSLLKPAPIGLHNYVYDHINHEYLCRPIDQSRLT